MSHISKPLLGLSVLLLIGAGIFLRVYYIEDLFTEYDDIGVVAVHKARLHEVQNHVLYTNPFFDVHVKTKSEGMIDHLLDSPFFPLNIAKVWTYPPGQYIFHPLLMSEQDSYQSKLIWGRGISVFFGVLGMLLFLFLMVVLFREFSVSVLLPLLVFTFSFNGVLYAQHMSPYTLTSTTLILALFVYWKRINGRLSWMVMSLTLGVLCYFNYLLLLVFPLFLFLDFLRHLQDGGKIPIRDYALGILAFVLVFAPLLVFFKSNAGMRGDVPPEFSSGVLPFITYFIKQFFVSLASAQASITTVSWFNVLWVVLIFLLSLFFFIRGFKALGPEKWIYAFIFLFFAQWIVLHAGHRIVMSTSRHVLLWLPLFCLLFHFVIRQLMAKGLKPLWVMLLFVVLFVFGIQQNLKVLKSKEMRFDYKMIEDQNIDTLVTYDLCVGPLVYFYKHEKDIKVYNLEMMAESSRKMDLPERFLLVSQTNPISKYGNKNGVEYLKPYTVSRVIAENSSTTYFGYNNSTISSQPNGFFLYELVRK